MNIYSENGRDIPVKGEYDLVVVGGGPAGIGAAFAAGRMGLKVLIVEQFNCLGGVATAGGHGHISNYEEYASPRRIAGGIANEVAERLVTEGVGQRSFHAVDFEVEGLKLLLDKMAEEAGVEVLYHTFFCESIVKENTITGIVIQNKTGRQAVFAKRFVDCTGDGDVACSSGCDYEVGRPADGKCQPVTLMFTIGGVDWEKVCAFREEYIKNHPDEEQAWKLKGVYAEAQKNGDMEPYQTGNMGWWWTGTRPDQVGVNFTHMIYIDTTKAEELTKATIEGRKQAYATIDVYRKYIPGMENCYMVSTPNTVGLRESRRIMGEYVMTQEDIKGQARFDDAICFGSFFVDIHCIDGPGMDPTQWYPEKGFKYQIPYRILVPNKIENLLVAGRCVSSTHLALGSLRVIVPCIGEGQAAGTASGMSIKEGITPREINVNKLQKQLRDDGMIIFEEDIVDIKQ